MEAGREGVRSGACGSQTPTLPLPLPQSLTLGFHSPLFCLDFLHGLQHLGLWLQGGCSVVSKPVRGTPALQWPPRL